MKKQRGFTIIEVLVIIVVIGILASIGVFAYLGVQRNARDTKRVANAESIIQAIELYARDKGEFPTPVESAEKWEQSSERGEDFLKVLYDEGYLRGDPLLDPINDYDHQYKYYVYPDGDNWCESGRGPFFVLGVKRLETLGMTGVNNPDVPSGDIPVASPESPGWRCGDVLPEKRDWQNEFAWVAGGYLDEYTTTAP